MIRHQPRYSGGIVLAAMRAEGTDVSVGKPRFPRHLGPCIIVLPMDRPPLLTTLTGDPPMVNEDAARYDQEVMQPLKAQVQDGRLVLDEPTDLPDGEVVELVPVDEVLANGGDYLDDEERERLHQSIERGLEDVRAGRTVEASKVIAKLRARAAAGR